LLLYRGWHFKLFVAHPTPPNEWKIRNPSALVAGLPDAVRDQVNDHFADHVVDAPVVGRRARVAVDDLLE
jgi:hypothetical protein